MGDFAPGSKAVPSFLYILGDLIYYNGEAGQYFPQFYQPYSGYPAPILAIPGNHDGDPIDASTPSTIPTPPGRLQRIREQLAARGGNGGK